MVSYLWTTYATSDMIALADIETFSFKQPVNQNVVDQMQEN